jgi:hypothetical protein
MKPNVRKSTRADDPCATPGASGSFPTPLGGSVSCATVSVSSPAAVSVSASISCSSSGASTSASSALVRLRTEETRNEEKKRRGFRRFWERKTDSGPRTCAVDDAEILRELMDGIVHRPWYRSLEDAVRKTYWEKCGCSVSAYVDCVEKLFVGAETKMKSEGSGPWLVAETRKKCEGFDNGKPHFTIAGELLLRVITKQDLKTSPTCLRGLQTAAAKANKGIALLIHFPHQCPPAKGIPATFIVSPAYIAALVRSQDNTPRWRAVLECLQSKENVWAAVEFEFAACSVKDDRKR